MIFVTVGTHEQPMDRLFRELARLQETGVIHEAMFVQYGVSKFHFVHSRGNAFIPFQEVERNMREARIIITHGGPATILQARLAGKLPIVVPRQHAFDEHVNDHQVDFARRLAARNQILLVENIAGLESVVREYDRLVAERQILDPAEGEGRRELCQRLVAYCEQIKP